MKRQQVVAMYNFIVQDGLMKEVGSLFVKSLMREPPKQQIGVSFSDDLQY